MDQYFCGPANAVGTSWNGLELEYRQAIRTRDLHIKCYVMP